MKYFLSSTALGYKVLRQKLSTSVMVNWVIVLLPLCPGVLSTTDTDAPVHHGRKPLPGAESGHILQLFISDPGWHQQQLWVARTEPGRTQWGAQLGNGQRAGPWTELTKPQYSDTQSHPYHLSGRGALTVKVSLWHIINPIGPAHLLSVRYTKHMQPDDRWP